MRDLKHLRYRNRDALHRQLWSAGWALAIAIGVIALCNVAHTGNIRGNKPLTIQGDSAGVRPESGPCDPQHWGAGQFYPANCASGPYLRDVAVFITDGGDVCVHVWKADRSGYAGLYCVHEEPGPATEQK